MVPVLVLMLMLILVKLTAYVCCKCFIVSVIVATQHQLLVDGQWMAGGECIFDPPCTAGHYVASSASAMPNRFAMLFGTLALMFVSLICPLNASAVFIPLRSPPGLQEFGEVFAVPVLDSHSELSAHTVVLALLPQALDESQPALQQLSELCAIDLPYAQQQQQLHHVASCDWPGAAAGSHFLALQSGERPLSATPAANTSAAFVVLGSSIKFIREGLTWLMRHMLLHSVSAGRGWVTPPFPTEPWTTLRSTQLARTMVTMPMQQLEQ